MRLGLGMRLSDILKAGAAPKSTLVNDLVSYWPLGETSGTRNDVVGANHLTDGNTVGYDTGKSGNCASFVALNEEKLSVGSVTPSPEFTVAGWFALSDNSGVEGIFALGASWPSNTVVGIYAVNDTLRGTFGDGATFINVEVASGVPAGCAWAHFIATYTVADKKCRVYVNNGTASSGDLPGTLYALTSNIFIGDLVVTPSPSTGLIDEVALWSRVLTDDERAELYNSGSGKFYNATSEDFEE